MLCYMLEYKTIVIQKDIQNSKLIFQVMLLEKLENLQEEAQECMEVYLS